jgi:hypothetical protein
MYTVNEIIMLIVNYYELDDDITEALCLWYVLTIEHKEKK